MDGRAGAPEYTNWRSRVLKVLLLSTQKCCQRVLKVQLKCDRLGRLATTHDEFSDPVAKVLAPLCGEPLGALALWFTQGSAPAVSDLAGAHALSGAHGWASWRS